MCDGCFGGFERWVVFQMNVAMRCDLLASGSLSGEEFIERREPLRLTEELSDLMDMLRYG